MKGVLRGQDLEPALVVAKLTGQLEETFVGFAAAVREKHLARSEVQDDALGEASLGFVVVKVRDMHQPT